MSIPWMTVDLFDPSHQRKWKEAHRPLPENDEGFGGWVDRYEPGKYDLVVLHLDNWCGDVGYHLRAARYRYLASAITDDVPQAVICHGRPNDKTNRRQILNLLNGRWLMCNSHTAKREWGYAKSEAIWHGYRIDEWPKARFEEDDPYAVTVCSGGTLSRYYHGIPIIERLQDHNERLFWVGQEGDFVCPSFDSYRDVLGRSRAYVHTTQWAPMSGSRTEAMLCGVPVITTNEDDEAMFLEDGENAFVVETYVEMRDRLQQLLNNRKLAQRIGNAGRQTARGLFNVDAYAKRWREFLEGLNI